MGAVKNVVGPAPTTVPHSLANTTKSKSSGPLQKAPGSADAFSVHSARAAAIVDATPTPPTVSVPGIPEAFPIADLSKISGRGYVGDVYLLDGGSLEGMKLQARRIRESGTPGLELTFRLQGQAHDRLMAAAKKAGAASGPLEFKARALGSDGILENTKKSGRVTADSGHAPKDMAHSDDNWCLSLEGNKGGSISIVTKKAAVSARGLVRLELFGTDVEMKAELDALAKSLGLSQLFAPPTQKSKQRYLLMRALWQHDHKQAKKLGQSDVEKIAPESVKKQLGAHGSARLGALALTDVSPSHFSVIDPAQAELMIKAGARYLYSTVESPEHVASILQNGQKSSLRRYLDGQIIDGMSTNEDFSSGGGVGVFTRLVTQSAIMQEGSWTGRRYKVILKPDLLARTDWYGHKGDEFGRAWGLDQKNFGLKLLEDVEGKGSYQDYNELIFRDSIGPQYIGRVVALDETSRNQLLTELEKQKVQAPDGTPLHELVVVSPQFLSYGPAPYEPGGELEFATAAIAEAKKNKPMNLKWFLANAPRSPAHAEIERSLLLSANPKTDEILFEALSIRGAMSLGAEDLDALVPALSKPKPSKGPNRLDQLLETIPGPLLSTGSALVTEKLRARIEKKETTGLDGTSSSAWVGILTKLAARPDAAPAYELARALAFPRLLEEKDVGFLRFLEAHPQVTPADSTAFLKSQLASLEKSGKATQELQLYLGQAKSADSLSETQLSLIRLDQGAVVPLLESALKKHGKLELDGDELAKVFSKLPSTSKVRQFLLGTLAPMLLELGRPEFLSALEKRWTSAPHEKSNLDSKAWIHVIGRHIEQKSSAAFSFSLEHAIASFEWNGDESRTLLERLATMPLLVDPKKAIARAIKGLATEKKPGEHFGTLAWHLAAGDGDTKSLLVSSLIEAGSAGAEKLLDWLERAQGKALPLSETVVAEHFRNASKSGQKRMVEWLSRHHAHELFIGGGPDVIALLEKRLSKQGQWAMPLEDWTQTLSSVAGKAHDGAAEARKLLLEKYALPGFSEAKTVEALTAVGATPKDLGLDAEATAKKALEVLENHIDRLEYDEDSSIGPVVWLLKGGGETLDDAVLTRLLALLPQSAAENTHREYGPVLNQLSNELELSAAQKKAFATAKQKAASAK
ncbi:MAG: hypothetical protein HY791_03405 [Deltaproteobacteria bacterium]|nr:hypothetical protein [Deltaproteobacteria bacterium]